ncbi:MAG: alpha/beta fold hydrolase [Desulforhopalus sp.]
MKIDFPNKQGEILSGRLELPAATPRTYALFAHCFTCSKDFIAANVISKTLAENGIGVLRFDFTGLGNSQGDFSNTNFSSNIDDLISACAYLAKEFGEPELLIGHSLGGAAVLKAAEQMEHVKAVVTIAAPSDVHHLTRLFGDNLETIEGKGEADITLAGRSFTVKKQFLDDIKGTSLLDGINNFRKALLVLHAPFDKIVSIDHAEKIFKAAKHPKSFITLDSADHLLSKRSDARYAAKVCAAWVDRYLSASAEQPDIAEKVVQVSARRGARFTQDIRTSDHHLVADEPLSFKGDNLGMNPYELLLASLGACTSMTMKMYADRKGIALEDVVVELQHEKIHAKDCAECETKDGKIDKIFKTIELTGQLSDEQKKRLFEIAERCPVNRTLKSEIVVAAKLK